MQKNTPLNLSSPIHPDEILIRIIFSPEHINDEGKLKPTFIPSSDINDPTRGLSVERMLYVKEEYLKKNIETYVERKSERSHYGFASIKCQYVFNIKDQANNTAFCLRPDPTEKSNAHAIILCNNKYPKSVINMIREELTKGFIIAKSLEEILV